MKKESLCPGRYSKATRMSFLKIPTLTRRVMKVKKFREFAREFLKRRILRSKAAIPARI